MYNSTPLFSLENQTKMLHAHTNAGSVGKNKSASSQTDSSIVVRGNLVKRCYQVEEILERPLDSFGIVETMDYDFVFAPFFKKPVATNEAQILVNSENECVKRMVCFYGTDKCTMVPVYVPAYAETSIEGTNTIQTFESRVRNKTRTRKIAIITLYRNINKNSTIGPATRTQVKTYIENQKNMLRTVMQIRQFIIIGDFNISSSFSMLAMGLKEITDDRMFHLHHATSQKTFIDKVYTNANDVVIKEILDPVENKRNAICGHKTIVLQVGKFTGQRTRTRVMFSLRKWRTMCKQWIHHSFIGDDLVGDKIAIDEAAQQIIDRLVRIKSSCFVERTTRDRNETIIDKIESLDHEAMKSPEASKVLKYFHQAFKAEVDRDNTKPSAQKLVEKGQLKLNELAVANSLVVEQVIKELHGDETPILPIFPSKQEFRKIIASLKNSNAVDYHGLSTTMIKAWTRVSCGGFNDLYALTYACARTGYYPKCLRIDEIHFLFKRKGDKMDPANYRPITLCVALSKIFDKITTSQLRRLIDWAVNNHAYIAFLSCQSALIDVSEFFHLQRELCTEHDIYIYIPIILCEDISGAFESIEIEALCMIFSMLFRETSEFRIVEWIRSYFDRTSFVREGDEEFELIRKFLTKTSPQGSILSPAFWRFYDALFTKRYTDRLQILSEKLEYVKSINHTSFADDKKTQAILRFKKTETKENIKLKIAEFALECRQLLNISTRELGCRINTKKSEVILPAVWQVMEVDSKIVYVWLGYSIRIMANMHLVLTDSRMIQRFEASRRITRDMYQYMTSLFARWKIYKTFVCPLIEWFLPVMLTARMDSLAIKNKIEVFQQEALCDALMIPKTVSREKLEKLVREKPVRIKMMIMANRLAEHVNRDVSELKVANNQITTRSGINLNKYPSADHKDIGDRLLIFADTYKNLPKQTLDNHKRKFHFDRNKIEHTTKIWCKAIAKHAERTGRTRTVSL